MQTYAPLVGSGARDVAANATDHRDPTQPAFITWRSVRRDLTSGDRQVRTTQRRLDCHALLFLKLRPFHCCPDP